MEPAELWWNSPAAVQIGLRGGASTILMFETRLEAEQWVYLLPLRQAMGDEQVEAVVWALLSKLASVALN